MPYVQRCLQDVEGPVIAATDYMRTVPDQIRQWVGGRYVTLGTDGYGRSDSRAALRRHFEVDRNFIVVATLKALADEGKIDRATRGQGHHGPGHRSGEGRSLELLIRPKAHERLPRVIEVRVPDMGNFKDVAVIDVLVKPGDTIESRPAGHAGDRKSDHGRAVHRRPASSRRSSPPRAAPYRPAMWSRPCRSADAAGGTAPAAAPRLAAALRRRAPASAAGTRPPRAPAAQGAAGRQPAARRSRRRAGRPPHQRRAAGATLAAVNESGFSSAHASPSVRRFARELGVDLARVTRHRLQVPDHRG